MVATDNNQIFSWGLNDYCQAGRSQKSTLSKIGPIEVPCENLHDFHKILASDNHSFLLDNQFNFYCWGDNFNGQLGLSHNRYMSFITQNENLTEKKIRDVCCKGNYNVGILEDGKVFLWPFEKSKNKYIYKPVELPLPLSIAISMASCGNNFVM